MRRFYQFVADLLRHFSWGRALVDHIGRHYRLYENIEALYTALILALIIKAYIFEAYKIPSESMLDTLKVYDRIFVNKMYSGVDVGDVIVFRTEGIPNLYAEDKPYYIKRVVGLAGDLLEIKDNRLYRNGKLLEEPEFFKNNLYSRYGRSNFRVPEGHLYVFGDNSWHSSDSRSWGGVPLENVVGKAFFRYYPFSRMGLIRGIPPENIRERVARKAKAISGANAHASSP